jgi:hypothetical protein
MLLVGTRDEQQASGSNGEDLFPRKLNVSTGESSKNTSHVML